MNFSQFVGRNKEIIGILFVWLMLINLILLVGFFSHDPLLNVKTSYYHSHTGSRTIDGDISFWNRNLKFGTPQFDKVFWDRYPSLYNLFTGKSFFLLIVLLSSLGVYLLFLNSRYSLGRSLFAAFLYGVSLRFLCYLPVWEYGWEIYLMFIPWMFYLIRIIKHGGGLLYIVFLSVILYLSLLFFENEISRYFLLATGMYLLYSFTELLEFHRGFSYFIIFFLKVSLAFLLALAAVSSRYFPILAMGNKSFVSLLGAVLSIKGIVIIALIAGFFFLLRLNKRSAVFYIYCGLLISSIMYGIIYKLPWLKDMQYSKIILEPDSEIIKKITNDNSIYRIYPVGRNFHENVWAFNCESIGGKVKEERGIYNDVINRTLHAEIDKNLNINWNLLEMLNVKYIISSVKIPSQRIEYCFYSPSEKLILYRIKEKPVFAWFAKEWRQEDIEKTIQRIANPGEDVINTVSVNGMINEFSDRAKFPVMKEKDVEVRSVERNSIIVDTKTDSAGFMVLSEPYENSENWRAYVDQVETEIYQVNALLRGIVVPPGEHKIEMIYEMSSHEKWLRLSYWAGMLILILFLSEIIRMFAIQRRAGFK